MCVSDFFVRTFQLHTQCFYVSVGCSFHIFIFGRGLPVRNLGKVGVFAIGACTGMDWLVFLIPIIWFYSFFNVHNLKSLSEEEFYSIEDSYVLHMDELAGDISSLLKHHGKITAILQNRQTVIN